MKRITTILLCLSVLLTGTSFAQTASNMTASKSTLTNADTSYHVKQMTQATDVITIQPILTKVSGTVAGYCIPQASLDGTNYINISTDTLTFANQTTNTKIWTFDKRYYIYYRARFITTGTSVTTPVAKIFSSGTARPAQ